MSRKNLVNLVAGLAITLTCLLAAVWGIDLDEISRSLDRANYSPLPLFLSILAAFFALKAVRWQLLLAPLGSFRFNQVTPAMMIGFMGNNLLPAHLGDLVRVVVFDRQFRVSKAGVFSTVLLERIFDMLSILALFAASLLFVSEIPEGYRTAGLTILAATVAGFLALLAFVVFTERAVRLAERLIASLPFFPDTLEKKARGILETGALGLSSLRRPGLLLRIAGYSLAQWALMGGMVQIALWSFKIEVEPLAAFVVVAVTAIGVAVPSSPGYFGVVQFCFWLSLRGFGANKADVFAASVFFHLVQYVPVTLVGLYFLHRTGLRLFQVQAEALRGDESFEPPSKP